MMVSPNRFAFVKIIILLVPLLFWIPIPLLYEKTVVALGSSNWKTFAISDTVEAGGKSISKMVDSSAVKITLYKGARHPWAGMIIEPSGSDSFFDASHYDAMEISASTSGADATVITLETRSVLAGAKSLQPSECFISIKSHPTKVRVPFSQFSPAQWWMRSMGFDLTQTLPIDFSRLASINIRTGSEEITGKPETIRLYDMSLIHTPKLAILIATVFSFLWLITCGIFFAVRRKRPTTKPLVYRKLDVRSVADEDAERLISYIQTRHADTDLTLENIAAGSGIHSKKIPALLKARGYDSFKSCLNGIRLEHAKELLLKTDRGVSEIALDVGYNTVTHFNRIFKEVQGISPSEFRKVPRA